MYITIKKSQIYIALLLLAAINIDSLPYIMPNTIAIIFNRILPLFVCILMLILLFMRGKRISRIFLLIIIYFAVLIIATIFKNPQAFSECVRQMISPLAICMMAEYFMPEMHEDFLWSILLVSVLLILVDIVTVFLYPNGMYTTDLYSINWFLGYKTARIRVASLPAILAAAILSLEGKNKLDVKFWGSSFVSFIDAAFTQTVGGLVCITVMIVMSVMLYMFRNEKIRESIYRFFNFKAFLIIIIILTIVFNIVQRFDIFEPIIVGMLGKNMTITNRLSIWNVTIRLIESSPIIGNGYITSGSFATLVGFPTATQPHSIFLSIVCYTGLLGLLIYIGIIGYAFSLVDQAGRKSLSVVCAIFIVALLIHGIISFHLFAQYLYASLVMLYYLKGISIGSRRKPKIKT